PVVIFDLGQRQNQAAQRDQRGGVIDLGALSVGREGRVEVLLVVAVDVPDVVEGRSHLRRVAVLDDQLEHRAGPGGVGVHHLPAGCGPPAGCGASAGCGSPTGCGSSARSGSLVGCESLACSGSSVCCGPPTGCGSSARSGSPVGCGSLACSRSSARSGSTACSS